MLDASIFTSNFHVVPAETLGVGMHRFDFYVLRGAGIVKYTVLAQDYKEAIQCFCYRFQVRNKGRKQFSNRGVTAYRLNLRSLVNGLKVCDDCVMKMVI